MPPISLLNTLWLNSNMRIKLVQPYFGSEEPEAAAQVMRSFMIAQGPRVKEFERAFADYIGTRHAVATSSGTTALHLALLSAGIKQGDEVITTPFTFVATTNAILHCGARPVFVDIENGTLNMDSSLLEESISGSTKAILPVHIFGQPADMNGISAVARKHGLKVIEDAAQAHGATVGNRKAGSIGDAGCFSFYATKNITTGEGGIITTNDDGIAEAASSLRNHGQKAKNQHTAVGWNSRMTDMQAAIGLVQLKKLDAINRKRAENAKYLTEGLSGHVDTPQAVEGTVPVWHLYTIRTKKRNEVVKALQNAGIECGIYYPIPVYRQEAFAKMGLNGSLPIVEGVCKEVVSIPVHPALSRADLDEIIGTIRKVC